MGRGLGWVTHRGPCQPRPFCDSVNTEGATAAPTSWARGRRRRNSPHKVSLQSFPGLCFLAAAGSALPLNPRRNPHGFGALPPPSCPLFPPSCGAGGRGEQAGARLSLISAQPRQRLLCPSKAGGREGTDMVTLRRRRGSAGREGTEPARATLCTQPSLCLPRRITESQHGRGWKGPLWVTQPNPLPKQGHPEQAAQHHVQVGLEYLQRRRLHSLSGQPGPGLHHPQREEVLPHVQLELPLLQFVPVAPCPVTQFKHKQQDGANDPDTQLSEGIISSAHLLAACCLYPCFNHPVLSPSEGRVVLGTSLGTRILLGLDTSSNPGWEQKIQRAGMSQQSKLRSPEEGPTHLIPHLAHTVLLSPSRTRPLLKGELSREAASHG